MRLSVVAILLGFLFHPLGAHRVERGRSWKGRLANYIDVASRFLQIRLSVLIGFSID